METPDERTQRPGIHDQSLSQEPSEDVSNPPPERAHAVRFASSVDEIEPPIIISPNETTDQPRLDSSATPDQIQALTECLHGTQLQGQRLQNYSFQTVSLPPSRIHSSETTPSATPQHSHSPMAPRSPHLGPNTSGSSSPITPAGTSGEQAQFKGVQRQGGSDGGASPHDMTPQASSQDSRPSSRLGLAHRPASSDNVPHNNNPDDQNTLRSHRKGLFGGGAGGQSLPVSRESSPSRIAASQFYTRPFTPQGEPDDPYAASKRPAQTKNVGNIDSRFVFSRKKKNSGSSSSSSRQADKTDKRSSGLLGGRNKSDPSAGTSSSGQHSHSGSMSDLRRFFKVGGSHKAKKLPQSPSLSSPSTRLNHQVPFADDHGLSSKYGKIGRVLGAGAGGSVKLMKRSEDNTVFAVKEFRPRHPYETEKDYVKKLTAEFCFGSALHHGNIIETLDIVQEKGKWYEVMEYAPYDLFAIVMTGKMTKAEINCCFLQILSGVTYLHGSGLAHRDLKLDNVVVSEHGIMKIIDFGSAHVFKYPFESEIVLASGIVGSDPYLAPEVCQGQKYDPQPVDIWSLGIIYCCMALRRFPWKEPRTTDSSFKLFAAEPTPGHDPKNLILPSQPATDDADSSNAKPDDKERPKELIRGPWRLLRMLPRESRYIIWRMLTVDPKERAKMSEVLEEPWVSDTIICRQVSPGVILNAEDHTHVLEPPLPVPASSHK
ncbi:Pkinase-domain-containing protein [Xylariaceae sp. FL0594]|nr:Pkinase-domain-containing protein [Xylariaceae sp. FL0594]